MGIALSTAGVSIKYCVETTAGTRPTTGYTVIPDIKETPDFNPEPDGLDASDLSDIEYKKSVQGLKDLGSALTYKANFTDELQTAWDDLIEAYATAKAAGKAVWFETVHPDLTKSVFFKGQPSSMGLPSMSVNSVLETNLYITPNSGPKWETKSTAA